MYIGRPESTTSLPDVESHTTRMPESTYAKSTYVDLKLSESRCATKVFSLRNHPPISLLGQGKDFCLECFNLRLHIAPPYFDPFGRSRQSCRRRRRWRWRNHPPGSCRESRACILLSYKLPPAISSMMQPEMLPLTLAPAFLYCRHCRS